VEYSVDARYPAQVWELETPLAGGSIETDGALADLVERFHQVHERVFAVRDATSPVEMVNWTARLIVDLAAPPNAPSAGPAQPEAPAPSAHRDCFFGGEAAVATPIFKSGTLGPGQVVRGPAIIEEATTTLVVYPGMTAEVSPAGHYLLDPQ
jgi:N-methylhydantoinase A/acetone carboxylase, beta subunit